MSLYRPIKRDQEVSNFDYLTLAQGFLGFYLKQGIHFVVDGQIWREYDPSISGAHRPVGRHHIDTIVRAYLDRVYRCQINRAGDEKRVKLKTREQLVREVIRTVEWRAKLHKQAVLPWDLRTQSSLKSELVLCQNGIFDLHTGELAEHSPSVIFGSSLATSYNPDAVCPIFLRVIHKMFPDLTTREYVQELIGYWLLPDNRFKSFLVIHGGHDVGKSTLVNALLAVLGREAVVERPLDRLGARFQPPEILSAKLIVSSDYAPKVPRSINDPAASLIKRISGMDPIDVEVKGRDAVTATVGGKYLAVGNYEFPLVDPSGALQNRIHSIRLTVPFRKTDPDFDPNIGRQLEAERCGILLWMIEGARRLLTRGKFDPPESARAAALEHASPLVRWHSLETEPSDPTPLKDALTTYNVWADEHDLTTYDTTAKFGEALRKLGLARRPGGGGAWMTTDWRPREEIEQVSGELEAVEGAAVQNGAPLIVFGDEHGDQD